MSLFRRDPEPVPSPRSPAGREAAPAPTGRRAVTVISAGTLVEGSISGPHEVVIEGELVGSVTVDALVIVSPSGKVVGELSGRSVQLGGKVNGNVEGRERVELTPSAALEGNIRSPRVVIAEGAFFKGKVEMGKAAPEGTSAVRAGEQRGGKKHEKAERTDDRPGREGADGRPGQGKLEMSGETGPLPG